MGNPFVHIELNTDDVSAAKKFYRGLFDWKLEDQKMGPGMVYTMIGVGKGVGGGMMKKSMATTPTQWLSYVEVDDVAKSLAKVKKLGGNVVVEPMEVMGQGVLGVFIDPTGAALGLWQPKRTPARKPAAAKTAAAPKKAPAKAAKAPAKKPAKKR
jgi:predicted enzyme related to lactoylglutathione lyase